MSATLQLPDYRDLPTEVAERLQRLFRRPVKLQVDGLSKSFATANGTVTALDNISFSVHRREFISVIGPSGCGKSTLIRILAGLESPSGGSVVLEGRSVSGPGADRGMVFQGYTLFPWLSVKRNVMFGLEIAGLSRTRAESEALQWIELVGLSRFADAYPSQLSGGMKQRVAIARALANQPQILFMDEPFGALDAQTRASMQDHLLEIWRNVDVTILFVTHDLDEAIFLSDRILVLHANPGRIAEFIEVPLPFPRSRDLLLSPHFLATKARLEQLIHPPSPRQHDPLPSIRLTSIHDSID